ncbi:hypothetical protein DICPUDRAFT_96382 [Dictyostelium purpureum]|uniref:Uncharacterized protein n=1 Tax=Dictyostelium purpureum TaxID=5786 RepID=F0Z7R8_DICPU|nr:uncharacterized protein DICPUDRAFT_96382 [Dictyostelium purpureum]EGC39956.1 hypothetical protein DICPUDRAFT_96382 [Dictyostelium purpureum]|eukprot:XP_003283459.1 hypothetical protein DICPUDRAFT_96382 [Dictyostelium purpureum]
MDHQDNILDINRKAPDLTAMIINKILVYCWNDKYSFFSWKVSLCLVSKRVFEMVSMLATHIHLVSNDLSLHLLNKRNIFKSITSLTTSFKFLEGFVDEFHFDLLEKNIFLLKDIPADQLEKKLDKSPLEGLQSISIRGPPASYVKKEKLVLQLITSLNPTLFKHFSMVSHKGTLLKNLFTFLDNCTNIESFGIGLPMSEKKNTGVFNYLKKNGGNLKRLQLCFNFKTPPTTEEAYQLNQSIFSEESGISFSSLETLELGHKKLFGQDYDSHAFDYPLASPEILFNCLNERMSKLTTLIFHKPPNPNQELITFLQLLCQYLNTNESLTHLYCPVKIPTVDILKIITSKKSIRNLSIVTTAMVQFENPNLERLELLPDCDSSRFFEMNSSLQLKKISVRDHICFEIMKDFLENNLKLESLSVALKGRTNFEVRDNPFLSIPSAKNLKKISIKFPHYERGDIPDAISRFLRFCSESDSLQYIKYKQTDFKLEAVNSFDFVFYNKIDKSYYYSRSLPKNEKGLPVINTDLKSWSGIDDQYDVFRKYVIKSRKLYDQLVELCKNRPGYSASYILKYTKQCLTTFTKEQWENSDDLLKLAHSTILSIIDQDMFANELVRKEHMNLDFLKQTAEYLFYGKGPTAKPPSINDLRNSQLQIQQQQQQDNNNYNNNNNNNNDSNNNNDLNQTNINVDNKEKILIGL